MQSLSGRRDGGTHRFFTLPEGGILHKADLGEGLDVIALGGYVILPPSLHPDTGQAYTWEYGPDECLPQPAPAWLLARLSAPEPPRPALQAPHAPQLGGGHGLQPCLL